MKQSSSQVDTSIENATEDNAQRPRVSAESVQLSRDLAFRLAQASVSDAVALFMRSEQRRHCSLADLEWLLLPPLMHKQIQFAYVRPKPKAVNASAGEVDADKPAEPPASPPVPVAMITWALVSPEVDAKIGAQRKADVPYRLAPQEWRSGEIPRVIDAIGEPRALKELLEKLKQQIPALTLGQKA